MAFGTRGRGIARKKLFKNPKIGDEREQNKTLKVMKGERLVSLSYFNRVRLKVEQQDIRLQGKVMFR